MAVAKIVQRVLGDLLDLLKLVFREEWCAFDLFWKLPVSLSMLLSIDPEGIYAISWMTQRWIVKTSVPKSSQASDRKAKRVLPSKSGEIQDGGRDQMLWQWGKGSCIGCGCVGTVSHKRQWRCSSLKKNVLESFRQRGRAVLQEKGIPWACAQAQRGRRARLPQGTIGSWHSWGLVCICGQVLRGGNGWGKRAQLWGSEAFTGKVMRSLGTTRVNLDLMLVRIRNHDHILNWKYLANIS